MCSKTRHATAVSNTPAVNGSAVAEAWLYASCVLRRTASRIWLHAGSMPNTLVEVDESKRDTCPSPHPISRTLPPSTAMSSTKGRRCASYSGSAPRVNSRCHQWECCSHESWITRSPEFGRIRHALPYQVTTSGEELIEEACCTFRTPPNCRINVCDARLLAQIYRPVRCASFFLRRTR